MEILQSFHASQRRRHPQLDWVHGRLSLVLFGASETKEKTAQMSATAMMVENLVMTIQMTLTMLLAKMDQIVRLAVLDVRTFGHPSRSSRPCRPPIPTRRPHIRTFEDFLHSFISCLDAIVFRHLAAARGPPTFAHQSSCAS